MSSTRLGTFGERIASNYLERKSYKILAKNYTKKWLGTAKGEIDIVARKDKTIAFVEVKTISAGNNRFLPEDKVNFQKQKKLIKLAQVWLGENKIPLNSKWQIDVIAIIVNLQSLKAKLRHFQNVTEL